jgi:hypothetical protein
MGIGSKGSNHKYNRFNVVDPALLNSGFVAMLNKDILKGEYLYFNAEIQWYIAFTRLDNGHVRHIRAVRKKERITSVIPKDKVYKTKNILYAVEHAYSRYQRDNQRKVNNA